MNDLERQIRDLVDASFASIEPVAAVDVVADDRRRRPRSRRRRTAVVAGVVVVSLLAAVGVAAIDRAPREPGRVQVGDRPGSDPTAVPPPTGDARWPIDLDATVAYPPALSEGVAVVVTSPDDDTDSVAVALDASTGDERWRNDLGARAAAPPVVAGDMVLLRSSDGRVVARGLADGAERWSMRTGDAGPAPVVAGDLVIIGSEDGLVQVVSLADGFIRARARVDGAVIAAPTFASGFILVATADLPMGQGGGGGVHVLDGAGNVITSHRVDGPVLTSPAGRLGLIAVTTAAIRRDGPPSDLVVFDPETRHRLDSGASAPLLAGDLVAVQSRTGRLFAYSAADPDRLVWEARVGANQAPAVVARGGSLVATGSQVVALDPATGDARWKAPVSDAFLGESHDPRRLVAISRADGSLAVVDTADGSIVTRIERQSTPGAVLDAGRLIWATRDGRVQMAEVPMVTDVVWRECPTTARAAPSSPDGMPPKETAIDEAGVLDAVRRGHPYLERTFGPVGSVYARGAAMSAWVRDAGGEISVEVVNGFEIVVELQAEADCPSTPFFLEGFPTRFYAPS